VAKTRTSTPSNSNYSWLSKSYLRSVASATNLLEAAAEIVNLKPNSVKSWSHYRANKLFRSSVSEARS
jgi:hypothetical protein